MSNPYRTNATPDKSRYPLFDITRKCIKCGDCFSYTKYQLSNDIIMRTCERCSYEWIEEPLTKNTTNVEATIIPFDVNGKCIKCNYSISRVKYDCNTDTLLRACERCSYQWVEEPLQKD